MIPLEIVRRAVRFEGPDRLPCTGSMYETDFSGDTVMITPEQPVKWWVGAGGTDEWGCEWEIHPDHKDMGQVKNIVLPDLADYENLSLPDCSDPARYAHWPEILDRAEAEGKYVILCNGPFLWERAYFLHGFTETLMDVAVEPELMGKLLRRIGQYTLDTVAYVREHFSGRIHGYRGTDDWGTQAAPFISPDSFRTIFKPIYKELFQSIHEAGMDTWMHSCGNNLPLLPDLIEAGLDVINLLQPNIFPIPALGEFAGKIAFEMAVDMQSTLPKGDHDAITQEIHDILNTVCTESGGLVVMKMDSHALDPEGIPLEIGEFSHQEYARLDPFTNRRGIKS
jgi:uroporphyrinogen decarboxylase